MEACVKNSGSFVDQGNKCKSQLWRHTCASCNSDLKNEKVRLYLSTLSCSVGKQL